MSAGPVAYTTAGAVRGRAEGGGAAFLGIPYAAPPAGPRRFAPPAPVESWTGERDATAFGPAPPQPDRPINGWFHGATPPTDEDCLSLNVWVPPGAAEAPRPVLVWLHGGGWALGFSGSPIFHGAALAAAADLVVTVNYRLGSLGWLHHPGLAAERGAPIGNWGLQDQVAALGWVRENIAAFGGDPEQVTLAGQSAGAGSVLHLLVSPLAEGLFRRAIAQSPPLGELTVPAARGVAWAEALSARLAGASFDPGGLRAVDAAAVVAAHEELLATPGFRGTRGGAMPIAEPATLPVDPRDAPAARLGVDVLVGTTADEGTFLFRAAGRHVDPDDDRLRVMVDHLPDVESPEAAIARERERAAAAGEPADNNSVLCRLATDHLFVGPVTAWAAARAAAGGRVHTYRVEHRSPDERLGAVHAIDVSLVFGTYGQEIGARVAGDGPEAAAVSAAMIEAWAVFAHGHPPWNDASPAVFGGDPP